MHRVTNMASQRSVSVATTRSYLDCVALTSLHRGAFYIDTTRDVSNINNLIGILQQSIDNSNNTHHIGYLVRDKDPFTQTDCISNRRFRSAVAQFISSDGVLLILNNAGWLWVDSRYYPSAQSHCVDTDITPHLLVKPLDWIQTFTKDRHVEQKVRQQEHDSINPSQTAPVKKNSGAKQSSANRDQRDDRQPSPTNGVILFCDRLTTSIDEYNKWSKALPNRVQLIAVDYTDSPFDVLSVVDSSQHSHNKPTSNQQWLVAHTTAFFNTTNSQHHPTEHTNIRFADNNTHNTSAHNGHSKHSTINRAIGTYKGGRARSAFRIPSQFCDATISHLLQALRDELQQHGCTHLVHTESADICWLLQMRGWDYHNNQLLPCALIVELHRATLYCALHTLTHNHKKRLRQHKIDIAPLDNLTKDIATYVGTPDNTCIKIAVDAQSTPLYIHQLVRPAFRHTPSLSLWNQQLYKQERAIAAIAHAAVAEGCSLVKFNVRLQRVLAQQNKQSKQENPARKYRIPLTEHTVAQMVCKAQRSHRSFLQPSFDSIVGYMEHGAFIHYNHRQELPTAINPSGILLLDCGGHYRYGTTDITRVLLCGTPTAQHITDYTYVLKALIAGSTVTVQDGSSGAAVDSHTRELLQRQRLEYAHGTGHGIGQCYNVHLGTEGLSPRSTAPLIHNGYVCSMEPGLYRIGEHGIRLENMIVFLPTQLARPQSTSQHKAVLDNAADSSTPNNTLTPHTLTRFPFERALIDVSLLTDAERNWINAYHAQVRADLAPHLSRRYRQWLRKATAVLPIC